MSYSTFLSLVEHEIRRERLRQDDKWGEQNHEDGTGGSIMRQFADEQRGRTDLLAKYNATTWRDVLLEEVYEAAAEEDPANLRAELIQVAAVACAWVEAIDRRGECHDQQGADHA